MFSKSTLISKTALSVRATKTLENCGITVEIGTDLSNMRELYLEGLLDATEKELAIAQNQIATLQEK